jgi:hypothetical protein
VVATAKSITNLWKAVIGKVPLPAPWPSVVDEQ